VTDAPTAARVQPAFEPTRIAHEAVIPEHCAGLRVDRVLAELFPDYSRSRLAGWIKAGKATIDGRVLRPRDAVSGGERVVLAVALDAEVAVLAQSIALDIVHEDPHLLVVAKPAGLTVHPGAGTPVGTLQNALLAYDARLAEVPRAGIVHRLDKDTSGVLVIARTLACHTALVAMLSRREIARQYEALVAGRLVAGGSIDAPIGRHPRERTQMAVVEGGRPALTHYRVRERFAAHTLLEVRLETGRTHQIRVHLAYKRHPIVGDPVYGGGLKLPRGASPELVAALRGFRRQALHAERIAFAHPISGARIDVSAPRPVDLEALVAACRRDSMQANR
jgi:23S rRNA pseudouridine1911/1915/1917 synthase